MKGRKSKYKIEYVNDLIEHMKEGYSYKSFAAKIGVHVDTLYEWEKVYSEFSEAKKVAFSCSQAYWEDLGLQMAKNGNASVWKFNMKNRFGWKENESVEIKAEPKGYGLAFSLNKHPDVVARENEERKKQRESSAI